MPVDIILGTVQFGLDYGINNKAGKPATETVFEILEEAYRLGIHTLDTADAYGDAASLIGSFHRNGNKKFSVNTKFGEVAPAGLINKLEASINQLQVEQVDVYFYHSYKQYIADPALKDVLYGVKEQKRINRVGLSVYTNNEMQTAIDDPAIDVIQLPFNLLDNYNQRSELLQKAKLKNKQVQVRSVFLQGLFFKDTTTLPGVLMPLKPYLDKIHSIAKDAGLTMEELCLQYVNAQQEIDDVVIGVDTKEQLHNNVKSMRRQANQQAIALIDELRVAETALLYPFNWK